MENINIENVTGLSIPISQIDINNSGREDYGDLTSITDSIAAIGLIQPIVLNFDATENKYKVAAGRRRLKALIALGATELYEGITCTPGQPGFVMRDNMTEDELLEVELEENLQRKGFTWTEEVLQIDRVHTAKQRAGILSNKPWGMRQTGQLLGVSLGYVSHVVEVATLLRKKDDDILKAGSLSGAIQVLMERKENIAQRIIAERAGVILPANGGLPIGPQGPNLSVELPKDSTLTLPTPGAEAPVVQTITPKERMTVRISNHLHLGDSINTILPHWPDACVDHIVTDIPYGIDMDNLDSIRNIERVRDEHDVSQNVGLMPAFLHQAYRLIKPGGFCVFFYDLDHHEKLQEWALKEGFKVQRWPLVWIKTHRCKNEAAAFNYTKATEVAMVLRKDNATLTKPQGVNYVQADGSIERKLYDNPFAKPFAVWKFIFEAIAIQGQTILDPFAGEMSSIRAAILHGLTPFAIELNDLHFNRGIEHVKAAYRLLTAGNVEFLP